MESHLFAQNAQRWGTRHLALSKSPGALFDYELLVSAVLVVGELNYIAKPALVLFVHGDETERLVGVRKRGQHFNRAENHSCSGEEHQFHLRAAIEWAGDIQ